MTPQYSRAGETKVKAFSFWPEDVKNLKSIMKMTGNTNGSEAVRAALAHYEEWLRAAGN